MCAALPGGGGGGLFLSDSLALHLPLDSLGLGLQPTSDIEAEYFTGGSSVEALLSRRGFMAGAGAGPGGLAGGGAGGSGAFADMLEAAGAGGRGGGGGGGGGGGTTPRAAADAATTATAMSPRQGQAEGQQRHGGDGGGGGTAGWRLSEVGGWAAPGRPPLTWQPAPHVRWLRVAPLAEASKWTTYVPSWHATHPVAAVRAGCKAGSHLVPACPDCLLQCSNPCCCFVTQQEGEEYDHQAALGRGFLSPSPPKARQPSTAALANSLAYRPSGRRPGGSLSQLPLQQASQVSSQNKCHCET